MEEKKKFFLKRLYKIKHYGLCFYSILNKDMIIDDNDTFFFITYATNRKIEKKLKCQHEESPEAANSFSNEIFSCTSASQNFVS